MLRLIVPSITDKLVIKIRLPVTYALNKFGLSFATFASLFTWLFLDKRQELAKLVGQVRENLLLPVGHVCDAGGWKNENTDRLSSQSDTSLWWYGAAAVLGLAFAMFACEYYPVQLRWYGAVLAFAISAVFFLPVCVFIFHCMLADMIADLRIQLTWVFAISNVKINIELFCRLVAGYVWEGKVLANIWFFSLGSISTTKGLAFAQDLKLGMYCNVRISTPIKIG